MDAKQTTFKGEVVHGREDLSQRLSAEAQRLKETMERGMYVRRDPPDPELLYFQIDSDVPWARVVDGMEAAAGAGFDHPSFVFALPPGTPPPPCTWVEPKFEELRKAAGSDGSELATGVAGIAKRIVESCPALVAFYGRVGASEGGNASYVVEGTGEALIDCGCDADLPALRSVMYVVLGNPHPTGVITVQLAKDARPLVFSATTTWGEASKQVQGGPAVWLATK
jgi:hypothetical protein